MHKVIQSTCMRGLLIVCLTVAFVDAGLISSISGSFKDVVSFFTCGTRGCDNGKTREKCPAKGEFYPSDAEVEYDNELKIENCRSCPDGKYGPQFSDLNESMSCFSCEVGKHSRTTRPYSKCEECEINRFNDQIGQTSCESCPRGKWTDSDTGATNCASCALEGDTLPVECPDGEFLNEQQCCQKCEKATYKKGTNDADTCTPCPTSGTPIDFHDKPDQCKHCVHGRYSSPYGEKPIIDGVPQPCKECRAGRYANEAGATSCVECEVGTISGSGSPDCEQCDEGRYSAFSDGVEMTPPHVGGVMCIDCPAGKMNTWQNEYNQLGCFPCPPGFAKAHAASGNCTACPIGTYSDNPNMTRTQRKNSMHGATHCTPCPAGWTNGREGMPVCDICMAGTSASIGSSTDKCPHCEDGKYCEPNEYNDKPANTMINSDYIRDRRTLSALEGMLNDYAASVEKMKKDRVVMLQTGQVTGCTECQECDVDVFLGLSNGWVTKGHKGCKKCSDYLFVHKVDDRTIVLGGVFTPWHCSIWWLWWFGAFISAVIAMFAYMGMFDSMNMKGMWKRIQGPQQVNKLGDDDSINTPTKLPDSLDVQPTAIYTHKDANSERSQLKMFEF